MTNDFHGLWRNDNGSEMKLTVPIDGVLAGVYRTAVGHPEASEEFPLHGFVNRELIVFCVNFGLHNSLTSWTGKLTRDADGDAVIHTLWHLARNPKDGEPLALWESILAGASAYRRP